MSHETHSSADKLGPINGDGEPVFDEADYWTKVAKRAAEQAAITSTSRKATTQTSPQLAPGGYIATDQQLAEIAAQEADALLAQTARPDHHHV